MRKLFGNGLLTRFLVGYLFGLSFPLASFAQQEAFEAYTQRLPNVDGGIDMVPIPEGEFTMGSPDGEESRKQDEGPQIRVFINAFWMGKYEITWDIYELYIFESGDLTVPVDKDLSVDGVTRPTPPFLDMTFGMGKEGHPAVGMTQYNAIQFCKWLYSRTGVFYRLPTEAEWEYACRAGTNTAYCFGNDVSKLPEYAWYAANSGNKSQKVGQKKPNGWGVFDMHGNAAEWTMDQYIADAYQKWQGKVANNPKVPATTLYPHAVRGGSFEDKAADTRSASRRASDASWKEADPQTPKSDWWFPSTAFIGLRIIRPVAVPSAAEIQAYYNQEPIPDY